MTPKFHSLIVKDVRKETEDTVSIEFEIPKEIQSDYSFSAGQYLTLKTIINGEDVRRSYSLCSAPFEKSWRVAVKQVPNGKFSTFANNELKNGMTMEVMTPTGNFKLGGDVSNKSFAFFAAGSGITPILAMTKQALEQSETNDVTIFYGNKGFNSVIFREELEGLKNEYMDRLRVIHVFSRESLGNKIQKGRIDKTKADELYDAFLKDTKIDEVYVCGPEEMIEAVKESMVGKGVPSGNVHFELFTSPSHKEEKIALPTNSPKVESVVTVIMDGDELEVNLDSTGINILDAAQEAGADLPFACKGGVCCTCKAKIIEGTASMDVNYALEPDEVEAGYILTCQSHPTSKKLIISFDE